MLWSVVLDIKQAELLSLADTNIFEELFTLYNVAGITLFMWASYQHHVVHEDFANLRKDNTGEDYKRRFHVTLKKDKRSAVHVTKPVTSPIL